MSIFKADSFVTKVRFSGGEESEWVAYEVPNDGNGGRVPDGIRLFCEESQFTCETDCVVCEFVDWVSVGKLGLATDRFTRLLETGKDGCILIRLMIFFSKKSKD